MEAPPGSVPEDTEEFDREASAWYDASLHENWLQKGLASTLRGDDKELPVIDRHELFHSTVMLEAHRYQAAKRTPEDWPASFVGQTPFSSRANSSSSASRPSKSSASRPNSERGQRRRSRTCRSGQEMEGHPWGAAPTACRPQFSRSTQSRGKSRDGDWPGLLFDNTTVASKESKTSSCAVPIQLWNLPRQDAIPCARTGRRADHGGENEIRIFIRLPGGSRFALWVAPDTILGPLPSSLPPDPPEDVTLKDVTMSIPRPRDGDGNKDPVKALLAKQARQEPTNIEEEHGLWSGASDTSDMPLLDNSLKGLIQAATGVPAERQKLVVARRGVMEEPMRELYKYDVGHGATLFLTIKNFGTREDVKFLASPALKQEYDTHHADFLFERMGDFMKNRTTVGNREAKEIVEPLPDWQDHIGRRSKPRVECPPETVGRDYTFLKDNSIFDLVGRIRRRFRALPRAARALSARAAKNETLRWKSMLDEERVFEHDHPEAPHIIP